MEIFHEVVCAHLLLVLEERFNLLVGRVSRVEKWITEGDGDGDTFGLIGILIMSRGGRSSAVKRIQHECSESTMKCSFDGTN